MERKSVMVKVAVALVAGSAGVVLSGCHVPLVKWGTDCEKIQTQLEPLSALDMRHGTASPYLNCRGAARRHYTAQYERPCSCVTIGSAGNASGNGSDSSLLCP